MASALKTRVELLKDLMKRLVNDVEQGIHPLEAGWIKLESPEAEELFNLGLVEKGDRGIHLIFEKDLRVGLGDIIENDAVELLYICFDIAKAVEVERLIIQVTSDLQQFSHLQTGFARARHGHL